MKKAIFIVTILFVAVISTACINNMAVQELNSSAKSFMDKGDYNSAIERLESSLELDSGVYETHYNLGVAYINAKQYQKAIDELLCAIKLNSKYADTYYSLAIAQESLADSLFDTEKETSVSYSDTEETLSSNTDKYTNIPEPIKKQMIECYVSSIENYEKYIKLLGSEQKTEDISVHIQDLEKVLTKLGYQG